MTDNTNSLIAYKSLDSNYPIWSVYNHDETELQGEACFGGFVFEELNIFNCFLNSEPTKKYNYPIETVEYIKKMIKEDESWLNYYRDIKNFLLNKENVNDVDLFNFYEKYKFFSVAFHEGKSFNKVLIDMEKGSPSKYSIDKLITFKGYGLHPYGINDVRCEKYEIKYGYDIFILDLWLVLFDKAIKPKVCQQCGDFFLAEYGNTKYCADCKAKDITQKRRYQQRRSDEKQYLRKRICEMLIYYDISTKDFLNELDYYNDKIRNKPVVYNPKFDNSIKTDEDIIRWLHKKHEGLKGLNKRKKAQHGKTDEASKRHGSDNQSIGKTQKTLSSDDNSGLER